MVRSFGLMLVVALLTATACSSDRPDLGPNDPETLVLAALLGIDDVPDGDWQSFDRPLAELYPPPDPNATPVPIPPEFESCRSLFVAFEVPPTPPPSLGAAHSRVFIESGPEGSNNNLALTAHVFATEAIAKDSSGLVNDLDLPAALERSPNEECDQVIAAAITGIDDGSAMIVRRERDVDFEIRGVEINQSKMTISSSDGVRASVTTVASFVRGHVAATYVATESDDGTFDHEDLIRAFIQRVTTAQLEDRRNAED